MHLLFVKNKETNYIAWETWDFKAPFMDRVQLPQGYRATGGVAYFLP